MIGVVGHDRFAEVDLAPGDPEHHDGVADRGVAEVPAADPAGCIP